MERAEHTARLVGMAYRMSGLKGTFGGETSEWHSILDSLGSLHRFAPSDLDINQHNVARFLILDTNNPSSVTCCFEQARQNAKSNRAALSREVWEVINSAWGDIRVISQETVFGAALPTLLDLVIRTVALYRGTIDGSILRDDRYDFLQLGIMIERADNVARLLDVCNQREKKIAQSGDKGTTHHWMTALHATSSVRAYYALYKDDVCADRVSDFFVSNRVNPRSLYFCVKSVAVHLVHLEDRYQFRPACLGNAEALLSFIQQEPGGEGRANGLTDFLARFVGLNAALSDQIAHAFGFRDAKGGVGPASVLEG